MQFKEGAEVRTADGEKVGTIDRIVLEPATRRVTHLVIEKGFLFPEDKVMPMSLVGPATEDRVILRQTKDGLAEFPDFRESRFVPADRGPRTGLGSDPQARALYWYPAIGPWWTLSGYAAYSKPGFVVKTKNIPPGTVAVEEGARVLSSDGEHVGDIERIFAQPEEDRATHLLISEGLFRKEKTLIPTGWMTEVSEDEVHLSVHSSVVERLPEYQPQD
jgi:uncharacterized protein YrrD